MRQVILRQVAIATAFSAPLLMQPTESKAIFHWCNKCAPAPVAAPAPAYVAPPAVSYYAPCAPPTVVNYVPQTFYRPVVVNTPVTSYQPVTSCGLCGPSTTMRPVTTMVQQTQYVPYTSYRLVYSAAMPAYTANYLAPVVAAPAVAAPVAPAPAAPACCTPAAPAVAEPAGSAITPAPALNGPVPSASAYGSPTTTYSVPTTPGYTAPAVPNSGNYGTMPSTTQNYGSLNNSTNSSNASGTTNGTTPTTPGPATDAPAYNPANPTAPPDIRLKPVPEDTAPQAGPPYLPPRQVEADNRTARARSTMPNGVIPASYAQPTAPMPNVDWRPSSR